MPVFVPSHANRASTAARKKEDRSNPLQGGLGSVAIEHRAQVALFMEKARDAKAGETEVSVEITKGPTGSGATFRLRLDPRTWTLSEIDPAELDASAEARAIITRDRRIKENADRIARALRKHGALSGKSLRELTGLSGTAFKDAREAMEAAGTLRADVRSEQGGGALWNLAGAGL